MRIEDLKPELVSVGKTDTPSLLSTSQTDAVSVETSVTYDEASVTYDSASQQYFAITSASDNAPSLERILNL